MHIKTTQNQRTLALGALGLGIAALNPTPARAENPIVQTAYTADPAPVVYGDRLYLYTSHDEDVTVGGFYTMNDWKLFSTTDMVNWTDHGIPAGYKTFTWGTDSAWAPQGISRNNKYYLYVPLNNNTGARIGVGVADTPLGPFKDPLGKGLAASGSGNIDPTVWIDDDGQAYMYWGNGTLRYVKLNTDMISYTGSVTNVSLSGFVEGPWFYKRQSTYYMVYAASGTGGEKLSYATSSSPTGPWNVKGDIMGASNSYTNHPGVADFKGHSYFFYHTGTLPGGGSYKRSVCVEEFTYGADGSIPKITMTKTGPTAIATLNPFKQVEAETIAFASGVKTEVCTDTGAGINVTAISNGDYIKVANVDFVDGVTSFEARVSNSGSNAKIELHLDSQTGTLLGTCDVSGASSWTTKTCTVTGGSGKHDLFLKFTGGSGDLFKFNWWKFTGPTMPSTGGDAGAPIGTGGSVAKDAGVDGTVATGGQTSRTGGSTVGSGGVVSASGGSVGSGGVVASSGGGVAGTGGVVSSSGGSSARTGGSVAATGGNSSGTGGVARATGGTQAGSGGAVAATGGSTATGGGAARTGGQTSTGTTSGGCSLSMGARHGQGGAWFILGLVVPAWVVRRVRRRRPDGR